MNTQNYKELVDLDKNTSQDMDVSQISFDAMYEFLKHSKTISGKKNISRLIHKKYTHHMQLEWFSLQDTPVKQRATMPIRFTHDHQLELIDATKGYLNEAEFQWRQEKAKEHLRSVKTILAPHFTEHLKDNIVESDQPWWKKISTRIERKLAI